MKNGTADQIVQLLIHDEPSPRVWSFLLTIFGDLAQHSNATISASVVNQLASEIGLKPEATRVALHRLKKEGWVESKRQGRTSDYKLTDWGLSEVRAASPRIYTEWPTNKRAWLVLTGPANGDVTAANTSKEGRSETVIRINSSAYICATHPTTADAFVQEILPESPLPQWISDKFCSPADVARTKAFHDKLRGVANLIQAEQSTYFTARQIALIRVLLVHEWRRLVLSWPNVPARLYPAEWTGPACRDCLSAVLAALPAPDISALEK